MTPEQAIRRALDAMVRGNGGQPVTANNCGRASEWEDAVVLDRARNRNALQALTECLA
jgi:hypothetical protein